MKPESIQPDDLSVSTDRFLASIDKLIDQAIAPARTKRSAALIACICTLEDLDAADQRAVAESLTAFYVFNRKSEPDPAPIEPAAGAPAAEEETRG
jgi:hypothetical protein